MISRYNTSPLKQIILRLLFVIFALVGTGYALQQVANAATANLVPTSTVSSWPGGETHTNIDEGATVTADAVSTGTGGTTGEIARFGVEDLANVASATNFVLRYCAYSATNANGGTLDDISAQLYINGTAQTPTVSTPAYQTSATSCTWHTVSYSASYNQTDVNSLEMEFTRTRQGVGGPTTRDDDVRIVSAYVEVTYTLNQQLEQGNYRFYENADSTSPGTALAAQDTAVEVPIGQPFRLRQLLEVGVSSLDAGTNFKLQFGEKVSTCSAASYGLIGEFVSSNNPSTAANSLYAGGGNAWASPSSATTSDDSRATISTTGVSQYLWADDFGFSVPGTATITGIDVRYEGRVGNDSLTYDTYTELVKNGSITGTANNNNGFTETDSVISLGGSSNLWGTTWTPADINDPDFGVALRAELDSGESIEIDAVEIYVYYQDDTKDIQLMNNPSVALQTSAGTASNPAPSSGSITEEQYSELSLLATGSSISAGNHALWDFPLSSGQDALNKTYCFRIVNEDGSPLDTYNNYAEVTITPPELTQANYRWFANADSATPGAPLAAQDTAATAAAETPVRLRQRLAVDTGGMPQNYQNYKLQYAEKVTTCSAATYINMSSGGGGSGDTGEKFGSASTQDSSGDLVWTSLSAMNATDGSKATAVAPFGGPTRYTDVAILTGYGNTVPTTATITGIRVTVRHDAAKDTGGVVSLKTSLNGISGASTRTSSRPAGANQVYSTGGPTDLFGVSSITPAEVNDPNFGSRIEADLTPTSFQASISIDSVSITVFYSDTATELQVYDNASVASTASISSIVNDPTNGARASIYQLYQELNDFTNPIAISVGEDGIWDFALTTTAAADGKTYCFRVVESDGTPLDSYTHYPEITIGSAGGPTLDQMTRGGGGVINGVKQNYSW